MTAPNILNKKPKLRDCPFCGSSAEVWQSGKNKARVRCRTCHIGIEGKVLKLSVEWLEQKLADKWNRRDWSYS